MENVITTKKITRLFANMKFWFLSWKKDKASDLVAQIKETIEAIKSMIARMFEVDCIGEDRIAIASMNNEVREIEAMINA